MPGRGETKLLTLGPAARPYGTPSTVTPTLLGPQCLNGGFRCEALGQGDRDVACADVTELAGIGQHVVRPISKDGVTGRAAGTLRLAPHSLAPWAAHPRSRPSPLAPSPARQGHRLSWEKS